MPSLRHTNRIKLNLLDLKASVYHVYVIFLRLAVLEIGITRVCIAEIYIFS